VTTRWGLFCCVGGLVYIYHLLWTIAGVNMYADISRKTACGGEEFGEAASSVFDTGIGIVTVWHMIEWIRWTLLLTTALVDANLIPLFNILTINVPFGFIACFIAIGTRFSEAGNACSEEGFQPERAFYLGLQVLCLILYIPMCMAHVVFMWVKGTDWLHKMWLKEDDDDEEEEGEKKEE
jgi:hypothetical protein